MGVPKFFRWMSERYPAISQLIAENRIPEFDCLYLDMNGIIHNCTHKDSDSPTFRMTEDMMFIAIFNYIEHLFGKIKPKKLFFMAVDGVAPRAKMNQQRSRRFRTALDVEKSREKAIKEGLEMPKEPPFDSNCITPGTEFMARLTQQLKYFISKKISEDSDWQDIEVVLSGHEVPGEGEHKIMEYIRLSKAQPGYDPNVRHCLYGLDADLVMLGLLSHDPHFCLLREEVTFGRASKQKSKELEHQNFYLMHLCVVREYLELEFQSIKEPGALSFEFDIERVIDDFILMAFFVGNDFLPNLPHLHINEGALALMFETYKTILPKAGGYINQAGEINLERLEILLDELSNVEYRWFESENSDASWLKSKQTIDTQDVAKKAKKGKLVISSQQKELYRDIKKWVNHTSSSFDRHPHDLPVVLPARDREFVKTLAESLHVNWETIEDNSGQRHLRLNFPSPPEATGDGDESEDEDEEAQAAVFRVLKQYDNAQVVDVSPEQAQEEMERKYQEKFRAWKNRYYQEKLGWDMDKEEEMREFTENYVQGLQWVLYYYYRGVVSWPWFFRYHYAPMVSDVRRGLKVDMTFKLGRPFRPFQQLMGVLPDRSKSIVPEPYHILMTDKDSPIIDFYPRDFELDLNGKKMDWEAVVKIPFIEEDRLLQAMATVEDQLTDDERKRNEFGVSLKFTYSREANYTYPSSCPGIFSDIKNCHCVENMFELPTMDGLEVFVGLTEGVKLGKAALAGFPSLKTLPFVGALAYHGVMVFQQESRNQSMVITFLDTEEETKVSNAKNKLGKVVHVGYPFLQEAKITKVSDELFDYLLPRHPAELPLQVPHGAHEISDWKRKAEKIENFYSRRLGMEIGTVESLVHVEMLKGLRKTDKGDVVKEYALIPGVETDYAAQTIVDEVMSADQRFLEKAALPIEEEFPIGARAFFLGEMAFGRPVEVIGHAGDRLDVWVATNSKTREENWARRIVVDAERYNVYTPSFAVAKMLRLNPLALSKLTSSLSVNSNGLRLNLGLNLKFEAKKLKVLGYSRRNESGWEFSQKSIDLIQEYMVQFPEFIAGLQRNPKGDGYNDFDFYPEDVAAQKMKEIGQWLKSIEAKSFEKVPLDAEQLDSDVVKAIEEEMNAQAASLGPLKTQKIRAVPRHGLLKPSDAEHRLGGQKFVVGDRIVYVQDSGKVPLGLAGTVIGITRTSRTVLLDVVLDATFMSGSSLGERCSPFRGATVEALTVLNLTNRQVVADTRASNARHSKQPSAQGYYVNGYGAPTGPNGQGQLFDASQPASNPWANKEQQQVRGGGHQAAQQRRGTGRGGRASSALGNLSHSQATTTLPIREGGSDTLAPNGTARGNHHGNDSSGRAAAASAPWRGRGGKSPNQNQNRPPNRQGFTIIDQSDPTAGVIKHNPNFRPQSYSFVPPPAVLDASGGGGRGNNTRGKRGGRGSNGGSGAGGARGGANFNPQNQKHNNSNGSHRGRANHANTMINNRAGGSSSGNANGNASTKASKTQAQAQSQAAAPAGGST